MGDYSNHPRYIPVIKWQKYEQLALKKIDAALLPRVKPCIEARTSDQHTNLVKNLHTIWPHETYVDYSNPSGDLTAQRQAELMGFLKVAAAAKLPVSPVIGPAYLAGLGVPFLQATATFPSVAIRIRLSSFQLNPQVFQLVTGSLATLKAAGRKAELFVDLGVSPKGWAPADVQAFGVTMQLLSGIGYSSVHLISGAFPASLASVKTGSGKFERNDWKFWEAVSASVPALKIGYGDYGTLSPEWSEQVLERRSNSIAIRYTRDDNWLILRATGKTAPDSVALSQILVNNYPDFKRKGYSFGDDLLEQRADPNVALKLKKCGHYHITEAWSHHVAYVLKEQYR
ncbi:beta family protein [Pseudomonas mediterranea]|uniref:beta family protein n=1 Tax=Pseudomonas mediterranea TaxID=183795 RepID=UPI00223483EB|nr:beta family protein [Pseudomonas mediterranea]UZE01130.1 beta family protein [Pseudomonas mediterranea]